MWEYGVAQVSSIMEVMRTLAGSQLLGRYTEDIEEVYVFVNVGIFCTLCNAAVDAKMHGITVISAQGLSRHGNVKLHHMRTTTWPKYSTRYAQEVRK